LSFSPARRTLLRHGFVGACASVLAPRWLPAEVTVSGQRVAEIDAMMTRFMDQHAVTGAAIAVARQGRLVHVGGYGSADSETNAPVQPHSLFRIASVSKPLTAVAILRLCQQRKLKLSDRVTEVLQLSPIDPRFEQVTVRHLLQHSGGFDRDASFDPMFRDVEISRAMGVPLPIDGESIVAYMLKRNLDFDPGTKYAYSNFGYLLLGNIVAQVSGQPYERFVRAELLQPIGVQRMRLGRTARNEQRPDEVRYVPDQATSSPSVLTPDRPPVAGPYGRYQIEPMAAHGGWLATAVDLVRFATALQGQTKPRLLTNTFQAEMLAPPEFHDAEDAVHYGCGVQVRRLSNGRFNLWHNGSLDGTNSLWVMRHDGMAWAVLFNQRYGKARKQLAGLVDPQVHRAVDSVAQWPRHDLFARFL